MNSKNTSPPDDKSLNPTNLDEILLTPDNTILGSPKTYIVLAIVLLVFIAWFIPPVYKLIDQKVTVTQWVKKKGEITAEVGPGSANWIFSKKMSKHTLNAFVAAEDARFYQHIGIDPTEIYHSLKLNWKKGRFVRGGSTITQQVVKMAFLSRNKSLLRKSREAVGAMLLELLLTKQEILEWYINLAEFGDAVYGVKSGAWHYFRTKPSQLTIAQAVHLALVLPSPNGWSVGLRSRRLTDFGHKRFAYILNRMKRMRFITQTQWRNTMASGDFGRPIHGYQDMEKAMNSNTVVCPGSPECPDNAPIWDEENDGLEFPNQSNAEQSELPEKQPFSVDDIDPDTITTTEKLDQEADDDTLDASQENSEAEAEDSEADTANDSDDEVESQETSDDAEEIEGPSTEVETSVP